MAKHRPRGLGRREPKDFGHVSAYPLKAGMVTKPTPVILGIPWYSRFDSPQQDSAGRWWVNRPGDSLGTIRGGHAICVKCAGTRDYETWHVFYDQGMTGECVGFSESRAMSLMNRKRYKAPWLYMRATERDPWPDNDGNPNAGTAVDAGLDVLSTLGHVPATKTDPDPAEGIVAYRWMTTVDEVHQVIASSLADRLGAVPLLNSWGVYYPRLVWMPDETLGRVLGENGEAATFTDR